MATETVVSPLLTDPPPAPAQKPSARPVDEDYAATVDAGYVESLDAFGARMDLRRIAALNGLAFAASLLLLALGHRIQTGGTQ